GGGEDVLFAQDRGHALDEQARALIGIGDHAIAHDEFLAGLEFDLERHDSSSASGAELWSFDAQMKRAGLLARPFLIDRRSILRTDAARPDRPATPSTERSKRAAGGFAGRAGWRLPHWRRPG